MISYKEAQDLILQHARSFGQETIGLDEAYGRVLAETILADRDYPPFNRSTVDGYALKYDDLQQGLRRFTVTETLFAGDIHTRSIHSGECYKIMTGAPVPEAADIVIRREDTIEGESTIEIRETEEPAAVSTLRNGILADRRPFLGIARKGEDLRCGAPVIDRPAICTPPILGLLASLGKSRVAVQRKPAIALLTTGNEVVPAEAPVRPGQIRNSNRWLLQGFLQKNGLVPAHYQHLPDDPDVLRSALESALPHDILILTGGVSAGDGDHVPEVLTGLGVQKLFHKIAIRPGKPVWCGVAPGGGMVFALPGNPFSCLVGFVLLIQPFLNACWGLPAAEPLSLPLATDREKKTMLDEFFPVCLQGMPAELLPVSLNGSGDIRMGMAATALALHPAGADDLPKGAEVVYYSFV